MAPIRPVIVGYVDADGLVADEQVAGGLRVGPAGDQVAEHLPLPGGQRAKTECCPDGSGGGLGSARLIRAARAKDSVASTRGAAPICMARVEVGQDQAG